MYVALLTAHGVLRWVVLAAGIAAIAATFRRDVAEPGRFAGVPFARLFSVCLDIQVLLGAALYLVFSPVTTGFFPEYHAAGMFAAFLLIHATSPLIRRAATDAIRRKRARIVYSLTLLLVLAVTPWWRPLLRF